MDLKLFDCDISSKEIEMLNSFNGPILIIGGSGFIGSRLFHFIATHRTDVYVASPNIHNSWRLLQYPQIKKEQMISLDLTNSNDVGSVIQDLQPQTIFNLATYGATQKQNDYHQIHQVNYIGSVNLLTALKKNGFTAYVQAGSSSEYGNNSNQPREDSTLEPNSDYSVAKGAAHLLIKYYGKVLKLPVCHLRFYSIYGPWETRDRLIPTLLEHIRKGDLPQFSDAEVSRDFVYIDDCISALIRAAHIGCQHYPGEIFNIATGVKTNLKQLGELVIKNFGIQVQPRFGNFPNRIWDRTDWVGNAEKANSQLGWKPTVTLLDGLKKNLEWENLAIQNISFEMTSTETPILSAIIACHQDEMAIPIMYERLVDVFNKLKLNFEIIFVNDGSPTNDWKVIADITRQDHRVIGISHSRNFGSQSAFFSGMEIARGKAVILLDGDLQDPPEIIENFVEKWQAGYDVVFGVRVQRETLWYMRFLYKLFYRIFQKLADIKIPLDAGDFSLIDRKIVNHILQLPEKDLYLRGLRAWMGFKQIGVEYMRPKRKFGHSTNSFLKNIWWAKKAIISFSSKPLYFIQILSVLLLLASFFFGSMYFFTGLNLLALSILGDYLARISEEVKNRPRFIRNQIVKHGRIEDYDQHSR